MNHRYDHKEDLNRAGIESTRVRQAVVHVISEQKYPIDVSAILSSLEAHAIKADKVTVYRILDLLAEKDLVSRVEFQEGKFRYEIAGKDHHHLICSNCGKIDDISDTWITALEKDIAKKRKFHVLQHKLEFYGICAACQKLKNI
jgi:Fur family ferric uptake transcriptional regulator